MKPNLLISLEDDDTGMEEPIRPPRNRSIKHMFVAPGSVFDTDVFHQRGITPFLHECNYVQKHIGKGALAITHIVQHPIHGAFFLRVVSSNSTKEVETEIHMYRKIVDTAGYERYVSRLLYADIPDTKPGVQTSYFLFAYQAGQTLKETLTTPLCLEDAKTLTHNFIACLSFLHSIGILHRDVKPANFFLPEGTLRPLVFDFGTSCFSGTSSVEFEGSRDYAHPTALHAFRTKCPYTFGPRDDMYAIRIMARKDIAPRLHTQPPFLHWLDTQIPDPFAE